MDITSRPSLQDLPPVESIRELFRYNPETGILTWRTRSRDQFATDGAWKAWNTRNAGKTLSSKNSSGYLQAHFKLFGRTHRPLVHIVAWTLVKGGWPNHPVDHINHKPDDNRWANLRAVSHAENTRNRRRHSNNKTGVAGVHEDHRTGRFIAQVTWEGDTYHLGSFATREEAEARRFIVATAYGFHINHGINTELGEAPRWTDWIEVWTDDGVGGENE